MLRQRERGQAEIESSDRKEAEATGLEESSIVQRGVERERGALCPK